MKIQILSRLLKRISLNPGLNTIAFFIFLNVSLFSQGISDVWVNEGGDKVTQEELRVGQPNGRPVINHVWNGSKIIIKGARNEVVNFNIVIEAAIQQTNNVSVSFHTLSGPGGSTIHSASASGDGVFNWVGRPIELFYVKYLQIKGLSQLGYENYYDERHVPERLRRQGYNPTTGSASGNWSDRPDHDSYYPDVAVPIELVPSFTISANHNQSIWADVYIPDDATPGVYTGTVTITETGFQSITIPVELTVYNFTLPDMPTGKTMLVIGGGNINERFFGEGWISGANESMAKTIQDRYFYIAHRHKISLIGDDSWINSDYTTADHPADLFAARLKGDFFTETHGYDGPGVNIGNNIYSVYTYGGWDWDETEISFRTHSNTWVNWFDANSPETEYFLYLIDESDDYASIEMWSQWLSNNPGSGSRLKSMATISLPDAVENTPTLKLPVSYAQFGVPSEWETSANIYSNDSQRGFYLYNGGRPGAGTFLTDDDGVALRANGWIQFKKHINRWFYWESTYYDDFQGGSGKMDLFSSAHTFGSFTETNTVEGETGWNYSNGDGVLFYPGTDQLFPASSFGVNGPFASLRLKYWRRGLQDHDYLTLASAISPSAVQNIVNSIIPKVVWEVGVAELTDPTWVKADISWSTNPDDWEEARELLANIIENGSPDLVNHNSISDKITMLIYPNPVINSTTITFEIPVSGSYKLKIYDFTGREIITLVNKFMTSGKYEVEWDIINSNGQRVESGIYFCQLINMKEGYVSTNKMSIID